MSRFLATFNKYKAVLGFIVLLVLPLVFVHYFLEEKSTQAEAIGQVSTEVNLKTSTSRFYVDIGGSVNKPGVYQVETGTIIMELIEQCGGFSENADLYYVAKNLNLSKELVSEEKIYVPSVEERSISSISGGVEVSGKVNLNTATLAELETLPGVGESTAKKIIEARPYTAIEDLLEVSGIGDAKFNELKDKVSV